MHNKFWICVALLLVIPGLLFTVSCQKKAVKTEASMTQEGRDAEQIAAPSEEKAKQEEKIQPQEIKEQKELTGQQTAALEDREGQEENTGQLAESQRKIFLGELVLFDYDSSVLAPEAQESLTKKAGWLKDNPDEKIIIEGHCDERGSTEYNLALGERRAEAVKSFLVDMGVSTSRLTTISYGKERPFVEGHYESAWALNRRAHFVIE